MYFFLEECYVLAHFNRVMYVCMLVRILRGHGKAFLVPMNRYVSVKYTHLEVSLTLPGNKVSFYKTICVEYNGLNCEDKDRKQK